MSPSIIVDPSGRAACDSEFADNAVAVASHGTHALTSAPCGALMCLAVIVVAAVASASVADICTALVLLLVPCRLFAPNHAVPGLVGLVGRARATTSAQNTTCRLRRRCSRLVVSSYSRPL